MLINFGLVALGAFLWMVFGWVREAVEARREEKENRAWHESQKWNDVIDKIDGLERRLDSFGSKLSTIGGRFNV